jgi:hypothetical protein
LPALIFLTLRRWGLASQRICCVSQHQVCESQDRRIVAMSPYRVNLPWGVCVVSR